LLNRLSIVEEAALAMPGIRRTIDKALSGFPESDRIIWR
jgi:hypothetical protein